MDSVFENRSWLAWLVKVRILILTVILGVELAIAQFTSVSIPLRLFVATVLLSYLVSFGYLAWLRIGNRLQLQSAFGIVALLAIAWAGVSTCWPGNRRVTAIAMLTKG